MKEINTHPHWQIGNVHEGKSLQLDFEHYVLFVRQLGFVHLLVKIMFNYI